MREGKENPQELERKILTMPTNKKQPNIEKEIVKDEAVVEGRKEEMSKGNKNEDLRVQ